MEELESGLANLICRLPFLGAAMRRDATSFEIEPLALEINNFPTS
jgi:hypothetical protein